MIKIEIDKVDNGWIVEHYSETGDWDLPENVSKAVFHTQEDLMEFVDILTGDDE